MSVPTTEGLRRHVGELETLEGVVGLLGWDEQTYLPPKGAAARAAQAALLGRLHHERLCDGRLSDWLAEIEKASDPALRACYRNLTRAHERARRVPAALVERLSRARSEGFQAWLKAKEKADFHLFAPSLSELVGLSREMTEHVDDARHPYDVLLEEYEPGTTMATLGPMFSRLKDGLAEIRQALETKRQPAPLEMPFEVQAQRALHHEVAAALGYDLQAGRIDEAEHPFTSGHGHGDVRFTTHYYERDLLTGLGGTIHETGHALYEQGLPYALCLCRNNGFTCG